MRTRLHLLRRGALVALLGSIAMSASGQAQILRPQGESTAASILRAERLVRFELVLPVSREEAFDAWTKADRLVEWLSHWAEMTVAVGEGFEFGWEGYEGSWSGRYLEIEPGERLVFTWLPPEAVFPAGAYETRVELTFEDAGDGVTLLVLEHSGFQGAPELEAQYQAWRPYLFALRAHLLQSREGA